MAPPTPLYYSSLGGVAGLSFPIGSILIFAPCESETLHIVPEGVPLIMTAEVPSLFAQHLQTTVIEPRLANLKSV